MSGDFEALTAAASGRALLGRGSRGLGLDGSSLEGGDLALALGLFRGSVPVVDHLDGEDGVEDKAGDEAVQNELVVDLLESGEDSGKRAGEVVEDLGGKCKLAMRP